MPVLKQISPPVVPFFPMALPSIRRPSARRRYAFSLKCFYIGLTKIGSQTDFKGIVTIKIYTTDLNCTPLREIRIRRAIKKGLKQVQSLLVCFKSFTYSSFFEDFFTAFLGFASFTSATAVSTSPSAPSTFFPLRLLRVFAFFSAPSFL